MKRTSEQTIEMQQAALARARSTTSLGNWMTVINGFIEKGIAKEDITPGGNVLTYNAWQALGRQVRKGEHGVQVMTWIPVTKKAEAAGEDDSTFRRPKSATVFHESQTDQILTKQ